jgi:hypothetical protein
MQLQGASTSNNIASQPLQSVVIFEEALWSKNIPSSSLSACRVPYLDTTHVDQNRAINTMASPENTVAFIGQSSSKF